MPSQNNLTKQSQLLWEKKAKRFCAKFESRVQRHFSEEFKRGKVKEIVEKKLKISELCSLYGVSRAAVYRWIYKYSPLQLGTKLIV